jgi:uncharacterized protein YjbI with pentapeptide repeats
MPKNNKPDFWTWIGWNTQPNFEEQPKWLGGLIGVALKLFAGLLALLAVGVIAQTFGAVFFNGFPSNGAEDIRNLGLSTAAVIGLPFLVWRSIVAQRQADTAEQGLITDRINKAVEGLGAVREVKEGEVSSTEPNLEVRVGALYSLERLTHDSLRDRTAILNILIAYLANNSPQEPSLGKSTDDQKEIQSPRTDVRVALNIIEKFPADTIDLSGVAFHHCDLSGRSFANRTFDCAKFENCNLTRASFENSHFIATTFTGSYLGASNFKNATFFAIVLNAQIFSNADFSGAYFHETLFSKDLFLLNSTFKCAAFRRATIPSSAFIEQSQIEQAFGDGSVTLPSHLKRPSHWPKDPLSPEGFNTQWRQWQRSIGFQPDENQQ